MSEPLIRNNSAGIPHHAYKQADATYLLCTRNASLCKDCREHGVPITPADPHEVHCGLFRANWHLPWQERFWSVPVQQDAGILRPTRGAHIIAYDRVTKDTTILGYFGGKEEVMATLGALCTVHNEMIARREPKCAKCQDTGATDYAGLSLDPCKHEKERNA